MSQPADIPIVTKLRKDEMYRVVVKPQGMCTTRDVSSNTHPSLEGQDAMLIASRCGKVVGKRAKYKKASPVHRLDAGTGGLVICSENKTMESILKRYFQDHLVKKRYRCVVVGKVEDDEGIIDHPLKGKDSQTKYKVVSCVENEKYTHLTTLDCFPVQGRRHQIRKHMQVLGHPIVNDHRYGSKLDDKEDWPPWQFLWAMEVQFPDPYIALKTWLSTSNKEGTSNGDDDDEELSLRFVDKAHKVLDDVDMASIPLITVTTEEPEYFEEFRQQKKRKCESEQVETEKKRQKAE